ncbi:MAG: type II CAAX endopeptidase family protein [Bacteroidota bacterium]
MFPNVASNSPSSSDPLHPVTDVLLLLLLALFTSSFGVAVVGAVASASSLEVSQLLSNSSEQLSAAERYFLRASIAINHLTTFVLPSLLLAWYLKRSQWASYLSIQNRPSPLLAAMGCLFLLSGLPLAQAALWLNQQIDLPQWAVSLEDTTANLVSNLVNVDSPVESLLNILVIAIIPALGEEFVFRGILQKSIERTFGKPQLAVWLAAFIFSAFHMQFEGFLARLALGALLGYLFYWSRNLWIPILAHFFTNAIQIIAQQSLPETFTSESMEEGFQLPLPLLGLSSMLLVWLGWNIWKMTADKRKGEESEQTSTADS